MAYSTSNPPILDSTALAGQGQKWTYKSEDAATVVRVDGYITNAEGLGMKQGDYVEVHDTNASPYTVTGHIVTVINANGSADLSDAGATYSTNTD